ncbi:MAG: hypothetical protein WKG01_05910 [Kofleriaceae bacterium]
MLPIEADVDDLRREVGTAGRYRVDPVEGHRPIQSAPAGYVFVHDGEPGAPAAASILPPPSDNIVIEAMRMNGEMARSIIDRFPLMMEAAATLLRAADGAGLPAREPRAVDSTDDADDADSSDAPAGFDLNALVAQLVPMLMMSLGSGKLKMPALGEMLDWRKAAAASQSSPLRSSARVLGPDPETAKGPKSGSPHLETTSATTELPPIDAAMMAHFMAVQAMLTAEESVLAREVASELTPAELRAWFDELGKLGVAEAAQKIRKVISGAGKTGGAS